jgi:hypothetical protein
MRGEVELSERGKHDSPLEASKYSLWILQNLGRESRGNFLNTTKIILDISILRVLL